MDVPVLLLSGTNGYAYSYLLRTYCIQTHTFSFPEIEILPLCLESGSWLRGASALRLQRYAACSGGGTVDSTFFIKRDETPPSGAMVSSQSRKILMHGLVCIRACTCALSVCAWCAKYKCGVWVSLSLMFV